MHVGTRDGADDFIGAGTEQIDLRGRMCLPGFIDAHNHLASMALSKLGVNLAGIVGRDAVLAVIRDWVAEQPPDAPLRGHAWMPDSFEERSPRRGVARRDHRRSADVPLLRRRARLVVQHRGHARRRHRARNPDPDPGSQYWVRDPDGTPTGHAVEAAATIPILVAQDLFSVANVRAAQQLTLQPAASWG